MQALPPRRPERRELGVRAPTPARLRASPTASRERWYSRRVIRSLSQAYTCRGGAPVIDRVDTAIFFRTYFMDCMGCSYCHDSCCQYGADVEADVVPRVMARADEHRALHGRLARPMVARRQRDRLDDRPRVPRRPADADAGRGRRVRLPEPHCARVHAAHLRARARASTTTRSSLMVCSLFPVTFDGGLLHPSNEIEDRSLQCIDDGPTLYKGVRSEIDVLLRRRDSWPSSTGSSARHGASPDGGA